MGRLHSTFLHPVAVLDQASFMFTCSGCHVSASLVHRLHDVYDVILCRDLLFCLVKALNF